MENPELTSPDSDKKRDYPEGEFRGLNFEGEIGSQSPELRLLREAAKAELCSLIETDIGHGAVYVEAKFSSEDNRLKFVKVLERAVLKEQGYASPEITAGYDPYR